MTDTSKQTNTGRPGAVRPITFVAFFLIALIALGYFGWTRYRDTSVANTEAEAQKQEVVECRKRLAGFYKAWVRYAADHKGRYPHTYAELVPKYISDPNLLVCPTAQRWMGKGAHMQAGTLNVGGKTYAETYGFVVFSASYPVALRKHGDSTVLIACDAHQEGMYRSVYHHAPPVSVFEPSERNNLNDTVSKTRLLVLRKNGTVDFQDGQE